MWGYFYAEGVLPPGLLRILITHGLGMPFLTNQLISLVEGWPKVGWIDEHQTRCIITNNWGNKPPNLVKRCLMMFIVSIFPSIKVG